MTKPSKPAFKSIDSFIDKVKGFKHELDTRMDWLTPNTAYVMRQRINHIRHQNREVHDPVLRAWRNVHNDWLHTGIIGVSSIDVVYQQEPEAGTTNTHHEAGLFTHLQYDAHMSRPRINMDIILKTFDSRKITSLKTITSDTAFEHFTQESCDAHHTITWHDLCVSVECFDEAISNSIDTYDLYAGHDNKQSLIILQYKILERLWIEYEVFISSHFGVTLPDISALVTHMSNTYQDILDVLQAIKQEPAPNQANVYEKISRILDDLIYQWRTLAGHVLTNITSPILARVYQQAGIGGVVNPESSHALTYIDVLYRPVDDISEEEYAHYTHRYEF